MLDNTSILYSIIIRLLKSDELTLLVTLNIFD